MSASVTTQHAVAPAGPRSGRELLDECAADSFALVAVGHAELVEEHLGALVRMRRLHARDEAGGLLVVCVGDTEVVGRLLEEPLRPLLCDVVIEPVSGGDDVVDVLVVGGHPPQLHCCGHTTDASAITAPTTTNATPTNRRVPGEYPDPNPAANRGPSLWTADQLPTRIITAPRRTPTTSTVRMFARLGGWLALTL